ncbi:hypothetical protein Ndes2437A_g04886 [Nannochloris sp. 'desiccata']
MAANPDSIAHENVHLLQITECRAINMEDSDKAFYTGTDGRSMSRFDHDPLIFTCRLIPKGGEKAFIPPVLSQNTEEPTAKDVKGISAALTTAVNALKGLEQPDAKDLLLRMETFNDQLIRFINETNENIPEVENLPYRNKRTPSRVNSHSLSRMEFTPEPRDHGVREQAISTEQSSMGTSVEPQRSLFDGAPTLEVSQEGEANIASASRSAVVQCSDELKTLLKLPGEEYNNKTVLTERIKSMGLLYLGEPEDTALYFDRLPGNPWWPGPNIGTREELRSLPKHELQGIYDKMRRPFLETKIIEKEVVEEVAVEEVEEQHVEAKEQEVAKTDVFVSSNGRVAASSLRPAVAHCDNDYDREALKREGKDHDSKSLLRDLIRHMALIILNRPKESSRVPYKELKDQLWWPAPEVSSRIGLWLLSLGRLREMYDALRRYFVSTIDFAADFAARPPAAAAPPAAFA